ncbi:MAG: hypothetical protein ACI4AM_02740 [Muribaculaceae bacterium]
MIATILTQTSTAVATPMGVVASCPWYSRGTIFGIVLLGFVAVAALAIGVYVFLKMKKENAFLIGEVQNLLTKYGNIKQKVANLKDEVEALNRLPQAHACGAQSAAATASAGGVQSVSAGASKPVAASQHKASAPAAPPKTVKFGTPMMPDQGTGRLKFAARSLHASSNSDLFKLELDANGTTGTYHINSDATTQILNDLDLFKIFVAPFTMPVSLNRAKVKEVKEGTLVKEGSYWVVERRLTVTF